jgi:hypothetical protein
MSGDTSDWAADYRRRERERRWAAQQRIDYALDALRFLGVEKVTVEFDGHSDEGELKNLQFLPPPAGPPEGLEHLLEDALGDMLPGGWKIEAGSFGTITLDVASGKVDVDQEYRGQEDFEDEWE